MGTKVLFRDPWMWGVYTELEKHLDLEVHFIANSEQSVDFLSEKGLSKDGFTKIFASREKSKVNKEFLAECEKKYDFSIWDLWLTTAQRNKKRFNLPRDEVLGYVQKIIEKVEGIVRDFKPDFYICYGPAGYTHLITYKILMHHGVKIIETKQTSIPNRFMIMEDLSNVSKTLEKNYKKILEEGISVEEKSQAKAFIEAYQNKPKAPDCAKKFDEDLPKKFLRMSKKLKNAIKYNRYPPNLRYLLWPVIEKAYDYLGYFEKAIKGEKYVFYPLHFQPEASTSIYGKWFVDQLALIETISKSLPLTHYLYVKEHPHGYGNRSPSFYKRIKRLPNVRLIGPHEDNFSLIKNSSLITTITGTAGWEGLLFQKPVITFGRAYYNISKGTVRIKDVTQLPEILREKLDIKREFSQVQSFVAAMFRSSYPGLARLPHNSNNKSMEDENLGLLAQGIYTHLKCQQ